MSDFPDLSDRNVLVTGASSGLGEQFARSAAQAGAAVAVCARRRDRLDKLVAEIEGNGGKAVAITMDVTDDASVAKGVEDAEAALGPIFSVVANAGISGGGPALETTAQAFRDVVDVNLTGVFTCIREAANRMIANGSKESEKGRIVVIASLAAEVVLGGVIAYNASKAGVKMLTRAFSKEVAHMGINVNSVSPGYVVTEINDYFMESEQGKAMVQSFPRKRAMTTEDLSPMVMMLLSDQAAKITGRDFIVDDGQAY